MRIRHFLQTAIKYCTMASVKKIEKEISISVPWGTLRGITWGDPSQPPVLLCHGKMDACSGFRPLVLALPPTFFYVSFDLPGNGRSDAFPQGVRYTVVDFVVAVASVVEHYKWNNFIYIGHSLGVPIGKLYNISYPGRITRMVELDPIPAHHTWPTTRDGIKSWYIQYYAHYYDKERYAKYNGSVETAPKYTYEKALQLTMQSRELSKEAAEHVLERSLVPAGDGLYRFTYDQRMKEVPVLPFSGELLRLIYTTTETPTFCLLAKRIVERGLYDEVPFVRDPMAWRGQYSFKVVEGGHDVHIECPQSMADDIAKFISEGKAKL